MRRPSPPQKSTTFTTWPPVGCCDLSARRAASISRVHLDCWDGDYELAAPLADEGILLDDFVLQVPRQDEKIIRFGFLNALRLIDGNVRAGQESAVFVGIAVDGVIEEIGANAAVIQERVAFSGGAVAGDGFSFAFCFDQKRK